jgi:hypothetical protein
MDWILASWPCLSRLTFRWRSPSLNFFSRVKWFGIMNEGPECKTTALHRFHRWSFHRSVNDYDRRWQVGTGEFATRFRRRRITTELIFIYIFATGVRILCFVICVCLGSRSFFFFFWYEMASERQDCKYIYITTRLMKFCRWLI